MRISFPGKQVAATAISCSALSSSSSSLSPRAEWHIPAAAVASSDKLCGCGGDAVKIKQQQPPPQQQSVIQLAPEQVPAANLVVWSKVKASLLPPRYGGEIKHAWKADHNKDLHQVALEVAQQASDTMFVHTSHDTAALCTDIQNSMMAFTQFCFENLNHVVGFHFKLVAKRGDDATFCPAFHVDYVPVRWIQTLHGPGTLFVDPQLHDNDNNVYIERIRQASATGSSHPGMPEWKNQLMEQSGIVPQQAATGQPLLMVGSAWNHVAKPGQPTLPGVLHRSPPNVPRKQGRVVLVLDVTIGTNNNDDPCSIHNNDHDDENENDNIGCGHAHGACSRC